MHKDGGCFQYGWPRTVGEPDRHRLCCACNPDDKNVVACPASSINKRVIRVHFCTCIKKSANLATFNSTGKTAALLCGSLAWLYHKRDMLTSGSRSSEAKPELKPVKKHSGSSSKQDSVAAVKVIEPAVDETGLEVLQTKTAEEVRKFPTSRYHIAYIDEASHPGALVVGIH